MRANNWFPEAHQVIQLDSPSDNRLRSIWIGLSCQLLNLPTTLGRLAMRGAEARIYWSLAKVTLWVYPALGFKNRLAGSYETADEVLERTRRELKEMLDAAMNGE